MFHALTDYKITSHTKNSDTHVPHMKLTRACKSTPTPEKQVFCLATADVRRTLSRVNPRKAAGPNLIPDIFNISLSQAVVPVVK